MNSRAEACHVHTHASAHCNDEQMSTKFGTEGMREGINTGS